MDNTFINFNINNQTILNLCQLESKSLDDLTFLFKDEELVEKINNAIKTKKAFEELNFKYYNVEPNICKLFEENKIHSSKIPEQPN